MKSRIIFFAVVFFLHGSFAFPQNQTFSLSVSDISPFSDNQPARLWEEGESNWKLGMSYSQWVGNNFVPYRVWTKILRGAETLDEKDIEDLTGEIYKNNIFGAGITANLLTVTYKNEPSVFGFRVRERAELEAVYSDVFGRLAWKGNKQFAGEKVDFGKFALNYLRTREYSIGIANRWGDFFSTGIWMKFVQGMSNIYTERAAGSMLTAADGTSIDFTLDYSLHFANMDSVKGTFDFSGTGVAFDAGFEFMPDENITLGLSILDLGTISWTKETKNYSNKNSFTYSGFQVNSVFDFFDTTLTQNASDSVLSNFISDSSYSSYSMPMPFRINLMAVYQPVKSVELGLHIVQGITSQPPASLRPYAGAFALYKIREIYSAGISFAYGGFNKFTTGLQGGVALKNIRFSLASDNILGGLIPSWGTGLDFYGVGSVVF